MQTELTIDIETLSLTDHTCDCCPNTAPCCCSVYDIGLTDEEATQLSGTLPLAAEFRPELAEDPNVFDEEDDGGVSIDKDDNGDCALSFQTKHGMLCALHAAALKADIPPHTMKPASCTLWPLSVSEPPNVLLSVCDDAYEFHCTTRLTAPRKKIAPALLESIEAVFGPAARERTEEAARTGQKQITVRIPHA